MADYRGYNITFDQKPMADRSHDWNWEHEEYDGPGDERCGTAETEEQAKLDIDEQISTSDAVLTEFENEDEGLQRATSGQLRALGREGE